MVKEELQIFTNNDGLYHMIRKRLNCLDNPVHMRVEGPIHVAGSSVSNYVKANASYFYKHKDFNGSRNAICIGFGLYLDFKKKKPTSKESWPGIKHEVLSELTDEEFLRLIPEDNRGYRLEGSLAYISGVMHEPVVFSDIQTGKIAMEPQGELKPFHKYPFSRLLIPSSFEKTFAQMDMDEYRTVANPDEIENNFIRQFVSWYKKNSLR